jgi:hypothetical protein
MDHEQHVGPNIRSTMDFIKVLMKYDYQQHAGFNKDYQITMIVISMDH